VYLLPPGQEELERRLRCRDQDSDQAIARRLTAAREEIARCEDYDFVLVNLDLDWTVQHLAAILQAERLRRSHPADSGPLVPLTTPYRH